MDGGAGLGDDPERGTGTTGAYGQGIAALRGFNLLEMFYKGSSTGPFQEEDFRLISELGFNFVRLPMDYRIWIKGGDWTQFNETAFQWVDQAIEYGRRYGMHVCLNFHRAPGTRSPTRPSLPACGPMSSLRKSVPCTGPALPSGTKAYRTAA